MKSRIPPAKRMQSEILRQGRREAWEHQSRCCKYCFAPMTFKDSTAEHRVPKSKGGSNLKHNIDAACFDCNHLKGSMSAGEFRAVIKDASGAPFPFLMAAARRRIWLATHRACRNIRRAAGLENNTPVGMKAAA